VSKVTVFRCRLVETISIEFNDTAPEPQLKLDNVALFAVFQLIGAQENSGIFLVGTSHFYYKDENARRHQSADFVLKMKQIQNKYPVPAVLCGDFNCGIDSYPVKTMLSAGLTSAYQDPKVVAMKDQWQMFTSFTNSPKILDHILYCGM
jgi:endonuclease/exonuclease/phosphatase family metal-dependent hydrolase